MVIIENGQNRDYGIGRYVIIGKEASNKSKVHVRYLVC